MGFFKIFKEGFDAAREQVKQNIEEAREQVKQNIEEARGRFDKQQFQVKRPLEDKFAKLSNDDEDDEPRIQLGKFENGVLEIREGITKIDDDSLEDYKHLRKIIFPASLEEIDDDAIDDQGYLEELDFSRVSKLKTIPNNMVYCETKITQFIIPHGVTKVNDCFLREANPGVKVYVPETVKEMGRISGNSDNDLIVYLFAHNLDVQEMEQDVKTLYVLPQDYASYARKLKDCESEARLREMPEEAMGIYPVAKSELDSEPKVTTEPKPEPKLESQPELKSDPQKEETSGASDDGIFSARLEMLIKSALQDGILTEQERAIILKRAEKEGEDPDEVAMIIEARLAEMKQSTSSSETNIKSESVSDAIKPDAEKIVYGDSYADLLKWKRVKHDAAHEAFIHREDSAEAEIKYNKLSAEYEEIKKAIRDGAKTIHEVESIISENIGQKIEQIERAIPKVQSAFKIIEDLEKGIAPVEILDISDGVLKGFSDNLNDIINQKGKYYSLYDYDIKTITIPDSVRVIQEEAFRDKSLTEIRFSSDSCLERIEKSAFMNCTKLNSIDFPKFLKSIGEKAFSGCEKLKSVNIPASIELIEDNAFDSCENLSSINFYETDMASHLTIGAWAFESCSKLKRISLPDTIKEIGESAFWGCRELETIKLPKSLVEIGVNAFMGCEKLCEVTLPETLKSIGDQAFYDCALKEIVIPDSVEEIGSNAFQKNESLESAVIGKSAKNYFKEGPSYNLNKNAIFLETPNLRTLVFRSEIAEYTGAKSLTNVTFADTVKELGKWAVSENANLEEIRLPESVTKIGYGAFGACENLKSIELSDNITEIEEGAFFQTQLREICFPKELRKIGRLGDGFDKLRKLDFSKVTKLETIPEEFIGDDTPKLRELVLPMGVKNIEECIGGDNLDRLFLPPTIEQVEDLHQVNLDIYCYAPIIEELGMMIESIEDEEDACTLYVLPEYVESYKAQRAAEDISEDLLIIDVIPEEFRYYYDN